VRGRCELIVDLVFEFLHGFYEAAFPHGHYHVNGIEVFLAFKASGQVCLVVCGCVEGATQRASEPEHLAVAFLIQIQQIDNYLINGDCVTKPSEKTCGVVL